MILFKIKQCFSIKEKEKASYRLGENMYDTYIWQGLCQEDSNKGVQPVACASHVTQDGYEWGPTQNHKFTENLFFFAHQFSLVFVYLICSPKLLFFQCGPETPKDWIPLGLKCPHNPWLLVFTPCVILCPWVLMEPVACFSPIIRKCMLIVEYLEGIEKFNKNFKKSGIIPGFRSWLLLTFCFIFFQSFVLFLMVWNLLKSNNKTKHSIIPVTQISLTTKYSGSTSLNKSMLLHSHCTTLWKSGNQHLYNITSQPINSIQILPTIPPVPYFPFWSQSLPI